MVAQSKEYWLERMILDWLDTFELKKSNLRALLNTNNNKQKILAILLALCGGLTCYKIYQMIQPKRRRVPREDDNGDKKQQQKHRSKIDADFFSRLFYLLRIAVPGIASKEFLTVGGLSILVVCQSLITNLSNSISGDLMGHLVARGVSSYVGSIVYLTLVLSVNSFVTPLINYLMGMLSISMRKNLTMAIHKQYYQNMIYYKTQNLDKRIGNTDQRITQDVEIWCQQVANLFVDFLAPLTDVIVYSVEMSKLIGVGGPVSLFAYISTAFGVLSLVTPNFTRVCTASYLLLSIVSSYSSFRYHFLTRIIIIICICICICTLTIYKYIQMSAEAQNREGQFRHIHSRTRINAESIAFYGGDEKERNIIEKYFKDLTDYSAEVIRKNFVFGIVNDYFTKYAPHTVTSIVAGVPVFFGRMRSMGETELLSRLRYLIAVVAFEFFALGKLIELFRKLLKMSGYTHRVHLLFEVMNDLQKREDKRTTKLKGQMKDADEIRFDDVSIYTPADILLGKHLSFAIKKGSNLVITGPNGAGKSSLFRILGGLWPLHEGTVYKPGTAKDGLSKDIFYLPQKPYNVIGSLRDQIIYPDTKSTKTDSELKQLLEMFNIGYLSTRHSEGFDGSQDWDKLSRGEQQRLAMVRLFYHHPSYAILDECTSSINKDAEADLYNNCAKHNITCITISHRPALEKYHILRLLFDGNGGWVFEKKVKGAWVKEVGYSINQESQQQ